MRVILQELRFALRQLRKSPGFTVMVVLTLALGIGAATAVFSLIEGILLRPLPFSDSGRLVVLGDRLGSGTNMSVTARDIGTYSSAASAFSSTGAYFGSTYELSGGQVPEEISGARMTPSTFATLGVQPQLGRVFTKQENDGHQPVAVISDALWQNRFHRDPRVLGSAIELDRKTYSIIGVMPRSFEFPVDTGRLNQAQLWVPLSLTPDELSDQAAGFFGYHIVARLKDGVTLAAAAQDADRVAQEIMRNFPTTMTSIKIRGDVAPLHEYVVGETRPILRALFVAVAIVLLIACVNVAALMLVRAIRRRRESAVRLALGARAATIIRESMVEGLLLSCAGCAAGFRPGRSCSSHLTRFSARFHRAHRICFHRRRRRSLRVPSRHCHGSSCEHGAVVRVGEGQHYRHAEGWRSGRFRGQDSCVASFRSDRGGDCYRPRFAHHMRRFSAQLPEDAGGRSGIQARSRSRGRVSTASESVQDIRRG